MTPRWHLGLKVSPTGRRARWANHWLTHPCRDLAFPFEVGVRAAHAAGVI